MIQSLLQLFKSTILISICLVVIVQPGVAFAEYRVFQLRISKAAKTAAEPAAPGFREVLSTLDPEQYRGYYQVAADEEVKYVATWRCYGRTNGRDLCPNPKAATENPQNP